MRHCLDRPSSTGVRWLSGRQSLDWSLTRTRASVLNHKLAARLLTLRPSRALSVMAASACGRARLIRAEPDRPVSEIIGWLLWKFREANGP